jgi:hypothetical protein
MHIKHSGPLLLKYGQLKQRSARRCKVSIFFTFICFIDVKILKKYLVFFASEFCEVITTLLSSSMVWEKNCVWIEFAQWLFLKLKINRTNHHHKIKENFT